MNPWKVVWLDDAEQELASIWLNATDKAAVTAADAAIQHLLSTDPLKHGAELSEGLRKLHVAPLLVFFSANSATRTVEVSWVAYVP
jgi:hypothetical protein